MIRWIWDNKGRLADPVVGTLALALIAAYSVGGLSAGFNSTTSAFSSTAIQLEEINGATACNTTGSGVGETVTATNTDNICSISAQVGADQAPRGAILTTTLTVTNVGDQSATLTSMRTGACVSAAAPGIPASTGSITAGFCRTVDVTVANKTVGAIDKCVFPTRTGECPALSNADTLAGLSDRAFDAVPLSTLAVGASATYVVSVQLDASATNARQGVTAAVPFIWSISQ